VSIRPLLAFVLCATSGIAAAQGGNEFVARAIRYENAEGVPRSYATAAALYCEAARSGNPEAAYRLGWMYANGRGLERNDEIAAGLFLRAAGQGHEYAARASALVKAPRTQLPGCLAETKTDAAQLQRELEAERAQLAAARAELARTRTEQAGRANAEAEVAAALERWASAWSRRDVNGYLGTYAPDFALPAGHSRESWATERSRRIVEKSAIAVQLRDLQIQVEGGHARARFLQDYRSDRFSDRSIKTLTLVRSNGAWLIQRETAR
jgi:ketosteroid isomerase-like protein